MKKTMITVAIIVALTVINVVLYKLFGAQVFRLHNKIRSIDLFVMWRDIVYRIPLMNRHIFMVITAAAEAALGYVAIRFILIPLVRR